MAFDPKKHLVQLKGKWYLETKYRIQWFRDEDEHPNGIINTELISYDPLMVKATVMTADGQVLATGHGTATDKGNMVWSGRGLEKAETAAIGRALGHAGYGTQFLASEGDNLADSPVERRQPPRPAPQPPADNSVVQTAQANGAKVTKMDKPDTSEKQWTEDEAKTFITRWRNQALTDSEVLAALGVTRLGEWKQSRKAADAAVDRWLSDRINEPKAS